ncbi:MAG: hypothetical protein JKY13_03915, partial [Gammaproteobacteria bacterium]|nr:hypothetical protein [Gammaproteobacteria bacterium]
AHTIQQQAGVSLKGGVGEVGDSYERHANAVADKVVQGESAESLINKYSSSASQATFQGDSTQLLQLKLQTTLKGKPPRGKWTFLGSDDKHDFYDDGARPIATVDDARKTAYAPKFIGQVEGVSGALNNVEEIFMLNEDLDALEALGESDEPDKAIINEIAAKLKDAHILLQSVQLPEQISLYRQVIGSYTARLQKIDPKIAIKFDDVDAIDIDLAIGAQDIADYRDDLRNTAAWGGLAEAEVVAQTLHITTRIFRIDSTGHYRRIITIGHGGARRHNIDLLHLGNHYVAIRNINEGDDVNLTGLRIETEPDGNCLYEALYIVFSGSKPTARKRAGFIRHIRNHVARNLSDEAIQANLLAILTQGERGGLGPKVGEIVSKRVIGASIERYDEGHLQKTKDRLDRELDSDAASFDYGEKNKDLFGKQAKR